MPALTDIHIDRALTNISVAYANEQTGFMADRLSPSVPVNNRSDKYFVYPTETFLSTTQPLSANGRMPTVREPGGEADSISFQMSTRSYSCEEYSINVNVTDEERKLADSPLQLDVDAARLGVTRLMMDWERFVARFALDTANYPSGNKVTLTTGGSGTSWASGSYASASSLPFTAVDTAKNAIVSATAKVPNKGLMSYGTMLALRNHPNYTDRIKYTSAELATASGINPMFGGIDWDVSKLIYNSAADGQTASLTYLWKSGTSGTFNKDFALIYYANPNTTALRDVFFLRTFDAPQSTSGARGWHNMRFRRPERFTDVITTHRVCDLKPIAIDGSSLITAGYLIHDCTA